VNPRPRILLADDHTMLLDAFVSLLEPHCEIVGTAVNGRRLVELALETNPEIIILDISMPELNGMGACAQLKSSASAELILAIECALAGRIYITPLITKDEPLNVFLHNVAKPGSEKLTARQREVLQLLAEGKAMKEVANILNITPRTIAFHKYTIMTRLGLSNSAELVQYAVEHRLVKPRG